MKTSLWQIATADYPTNGSIEAKIEFWLRYAILAPSAHNTQPWAWQIKDNCLFVMRDSGYTLQEGDPTLRETFLSLGAFIENFIVAANHWSYRVEVRYLAETVHELTVAKLEISTSSEKSPSYLFDGLTKRHTNRGYYRADLNPELIDILKKQKDDGLETFFITEKKKKERIAELVGKGTKIALSMRRMRDELSELVSRESDSAEAGMSVEALQEKPEAEITGKDWVLYKLDPQEQGRYWTDTFAKSPVHIIVGSEMDDPIAWLKAGRLMERMLLVSASYGYVHCISAGPIEIPTLLPLLRHEIEAEYRPQCLFRIGQPENKEFTRISPRRPVKAC